MTNTIKLPCGIDKDGNTVYIKDALRGAACNCFCPSCKQPLEARKGSERAHHFAHKNNGINCEHGFQSALHYMAKDLFMEMQYLIFVKNGKPVQYKIDSVELECRVNEIIPDILITCDGKKFIVEIFVTHAVDDEKKQRIRDMRISAIEIDLSKYPRGKLDKEVLKDELCKTENYSWVYDADEDLINDKKEVIENFGLLIHMDLGKSICCPILSNQKDTFTRFVNISFCQKCPNCVWNGTTNYIRCGRIQPILLNNETRNKASNLAVFVNDKKVLFKSELEKYNKEYPQELQLAVKIQYRIFQNIALSMYAPSVSYATNMPHQTYHKKNYSYYHHRKRR